MSIRERLKALEKRVEAHEKRNHVLEQGAKQYCQQVDQYVKSVDELKTDMAEFVAQNKRERAAWEKTEQALLAAALAVSGKYHYCGPRRTQGSQ